MQSVAFKMAVKIMIILLSFMSICCAYSENSNSVPVVMWEPKSNTNTVDYEVPAMKHINDVSFEDILEKTAEGKDMILLFAEDMLCVEDLSTRSKSGLSASYPKLEALTYTDILVYLPSVHAPMNVLYDLPKQGPQWQHSILLPSGLDPELEALDPEDHYLLITFEDTNETESRIDMLRRHDSFIHVTYEKLKKNRNVLAIYTALMSSWPKIAESKLRRTREAEDEEISTTSFPETGSTTESSPMEFSSCRPKYCIYGLDNTVMIYCSPPPFFTHNGEDSTLNGSYAFYVETPEDAEYPAMAEQTLFVMYATVTLRFHFTLFMTKYWIMDGVIAEITSTKENVSLTYIGKPLIQAPLGMSYHCNIFNNNNFTSNTTTLSFRTFQVQPHFNGEKILKFHDAYDCVPFITPTIISCLLITTFLGLIIMCGVSMLLSIKTMDRFDDAKGKTITINVTGE